MIKTKCFKNKLQIYFCFSPNSLAAVGVLAVSLGAQWTYVAHVGLHARALFIEKQMKNQHFCLQHVPPCAWRVPGVSVASVASERTSRSFQKSPELTEYEKCTRM